MSLGVGLLLAFHATQYRTAFSVLALACGLLASWYLTPPTVVMRAYVVMLLAGFAVFPVLAGEPLRLLAPVWAMLGIWLCGWAFGSTMAPRLRRTVRSAHVSRDWSVVAILLLVCAGLALSAFRVAGRTSAYGSQIQGQIDASPQSLLLAAVPAGIGVLYWMVRLSPQYGARWRSWTRLAVIVQSILMLFSGFRGAAPAFLLTVWLVGRTYGVERSAARAGKTVRFVRIGASVLVVGTLIQIAAFQRAQISRDLGRGVTEGTRTFSLSDPLAFADRFDYVAFAGPALNADVTPAAKAAVSPVRQLQALIPRVLWPGKPAILYGEEVGLALFNVPREYHSSSTITFLGDLFVQGGAILVVIVGALFAMVFGRTLMVRRRRTGMGIATTYLAITILLRLEQPIILSAADGFRVGLLLWAVGLTGRLFVKRRPKAMSLAPIPSSELVPATAL